MQPDRIDSTSSASIRLCLSSRSPPPSPLRGPRRPLKDQASPPPGPSPPALGAAPIVDPISGERVELTLLLSEAAVATVDLWSVAPTVLVTRAPGAGARGAALRSTSGGARGATTTSPLLHRSFDHVVHCLGE